MILNDDQKLILFKSISKFAQKCRVDLGIDEVELSDEIFNATVEEISSAVKGKKDYSKYKFEGNEYGKGRLVHAVVSHYVSNNPSISLNEMIKIFTPGKDGIAGHKWGVFQTKEFGLKVSKRNKKGNRLYSVKEIEVINKIYALVKVNGYTLDGAKKALKDKSSNPSIDEKQLVITKLSNIRERLILLKS